MMASLDKQKKQIHFIRHAESISNVLRRELRIDTLPHKQIPVIPDPGLTYEGIQQTKRLSEYVGLTLKPRVAICSPYTRTLHTCLLSFGSNNVVVTPLCGECMSSYDDIGLPASYLKVLFPMLDFSSLHEVWWHVQDGVTSQPEAVKNFGQENFPIESDGLLAARMERFYEFLMKTPEDNIVVFSHNDFLTLFLTKYFAFTDNYLANCEVFSVNI